MGRRAALLFVLLLLAPIPAEVRLRFVGHGCRLCGAEQRVARLPTSTTV